jgi:hypothetical protein
MQFLSSSFDNRTKFLALFLLWVVCLGLTTLSAQHSCNPLIGAPSVKCSQVIASRDSSGKSGDNPGKPEVKEKWEQSSKENTNRPTQPPKINSKDSGNVPTTGQQKSSRNLMPAAAGAGSAAAAGVGASALASAGVISTTITVGGAVIATPVAVAVAAGILVFLAVRSFTRGA